MKKSLVLGAASFAAVGLVGAATLNASAQNGPSYANGTGSGIQRHDGSGGGYGRQSSLESRAKVLGMTAAELETALQTKTMSQLAVEKGMSQTDFEAKMQAAAEERWKTRGLSSEEIATRLADRERRQAANAADHEFGSGEGNHQGGYGRNR